MERLAAFLRSIGLKTEERSIFIGFHTIRIAWLFTTIVLMVWSFQGLIASGHLETQVFVFLASQAVFWLAYLYYRKKFGG